MSERHALAPLRRVSTDPLEVAYYETGSEAGDTALLLHGFPCDIHSYVDVAPLLADSGFRVVIPYLRGHGPTRFLSGSTPRSGQQAALGADVAAALWPERVLGLVSVNMVAPLTVTLLASVDASNAGLAGGINNAAARAAGLVSVAALPLLVGMGPEAYRSDAAFDAAFTRAMPLCAGLPAVGAAVSFSTLRQTATAPREEYFEQVSRPAHASGEERAAFFDKHDSYFVE